MPTSQTEFYDVFLIDNDFAIERPKRVYRTGFHFVTGNGSIKSLAHKGDDVANVGNADENDFDTDNPLTQQMIIASGEGKGEKADEMHDDGESKASQHTFFIVNSQRRLKLVARNAVSRCLR